MIDSMRQRVRATLDRLRRELLEQRNAHGHWEGELSPSALSTATAISAMSAVLIHGDDPPVAPETLKHCIERGLEALQSQQNDDGGFGDTDRSHSNIATSYLVLAASKLCQQSIGRSLPTGQMERLVDYIEATGSFDALRARYGTDKTFVVPILTNLAIAGLVDWNDVPALPFEAAVFPQSMYRLLRMPVVSYAIPALVAIGQTRHFYGRQAFAPLRWIRSASIRPSMRVLLQMQPESGGYLEATPLTSFVVMSLAVTGRSEHKVCQNGLRFLVQSMNDRGSWPIDTNLATWVTSLAMYALSCDPDDDGKWCSPELIQWHLGCQHHQRHPYTGAEPGGWGWSDLSGAVPDSDDTPAAILALARASRWHRDENHAVRKGLQAGTGWLMRLQNRDGGWPTFCRGWGKLPFDRSSNDLTAHAIRALDVANLFLDQTEPTSMRDRARAFLLKHQQPDGSWLPLWFGNQDRADESNPVYGTSRVLVAGASFLGAEPVVRGCGYLLGAQNEDGGWGGGRSVSSWLATIGEQDQKSLEIEDPSCGITSSVEETALAIDALVSVLGAERNHPRHRGVKTPYDEGIPQPTGARIEAISLENALNSDLLAKVPSNAGKGTPGEAIIRGVEFLLKSIDAERHHVAWPIGFYFAKLWYHEKLYPLVFAMTALGKFLRLTESREMQDWPR